ncbi:PHD finger protein MALE STERILITY 1 [Platanthera zijinensis]|uniref:PHD finger protein MALE STERILITY 1 n=1 Tax=Platanthera zijinensis TaxID=2320716 RepID=A0AAP0BR81_9ASPA
MICCKRFHILLPSKESARPDHQQGEKLTIEVNGVDSEKHTIRSKLAMHVENHLLHGILHLNGFGHLICINGYEGGSEFLSGHQIMDFWDRICTALQSKKKKTFVEDIIVNVVAVIARNIEHESSVTSKLSSPISKVGMLYAAIKAITDLTEDDVIQDIDMLSVDDIKSNMFTALPMPIRRTRLRLHLLD